MSKTINLGRVTAYADAVAAGYTGTREQFANDLANAANYAAEAGDAAETATEAATTASTAAETATDKAEEASADAEQAHADAQAILVAKETAVAAANTASSKAGEAANSAQQAAASETAAAGSATTASNAATSATASKNAAAASETNAANSASQASQTLTNVNQAGATQVAAIQAKGTEVLNSIPADYTELSNDVDDLKSDIIEDESNYGTYAIGVKNYYSATIEKTVNYYIADDGTVTQYDNMWYSDLIPVDATDCRFVVDADDGTANAVRIHGYDANGAWVRMLAKYTNVGSGKAVVDSIISIPSNVVYVRLSMYRTKHVAYLGTGLKPLTERFEEDETRFNEVFRESTNLIILENAQNGVVLVQGTGEVQDNARFSTTEFIKVNTDTPYSFKYVRRIAMYDSNMSFISALQYDSVTVAQTINSGKAEYLRLSFESTYSSMVLLNKSATLLDYEKGYRYVKEKFVDKQIITDLIESYSPANNDKYYFSPRMPSGLYKAQTCEGYNATSHFTDTISLSDIYGVYDAMVAQNPDYATRTLLGKDQTGEYDIFMYDFNPVEANAINFTAQLPKIVITTDTHGEEKSSTIGLRNFMRDICNNWVDDDLLEYLRWNVHFIIIPIVNPYGFVNHTRQNGRNVDLNRNFDAYWDSFPYDEDHYKGDSPFSEKESQYVRDVILANPDIACFIDYHMNGSNYTFNEWFRTFWFDLMAEEPDKGNLRTVAKSTARDMTALGQARYDVPRNSGTLGLITIEGNTPMLAKWVSLQGITSLVIEATNRILGETETYTAKCNQFNTEFTGNWILNILRQLYRKSVFS